jgi:hypothetical protein
MQKIAIPRWLCILLGLFCFVLPSLAGEQNVPPSTPRNPFAKGATEVQVLGGAFFSIDSGLPTKPAINFALESLRFGIMLGDPGWSGFFRGNGELLVDVFGGQIFTGPGSGLAGALLMVRYNFIQEDSFAVPYCQFGGGGAYNDIASSESQSLVGSEIEFSLEAGLGVRFLLNERVSLTVEHDVLHLSNGGFARRNNGLNTLGGLLGIGVSF